MSPALHKNRNDCTKTNNQKNPYRIIPWPTLTRFRLPYVGRALQRLVFVLYVIRFPGSGYWRRLLDTRIAITS